jgi:predicted PurR-regulated permease PerM
MDRNYYLKVVLTTLTIIGTLFSAYLLFLVWPVILIFLISLLIVVALEPAVKTLTGLQIKSFVISRTLAVVISYVAFVAFFVLVITSGIPLVVEQSNYVRNAMGEFASVEGLESSYEQFSDYLGNILNASGGILDATFAAFSFLFTIFSVLVTVLYLSLEWESIKSKVIVSMFPKG